MLKRYTFWLWTAVVFQLLTAFLHSLSLFITPIPNDETQRRMMELMATYKMDLGGGFHRTSDDLLTALSSCFSLLCLFGAMINAYLLKKAPRNLMNGVLPINILVFGACFAMMAVFTFCRRSFCPAWSLSVWSFLIFACVCAGRKRHKEIVFFVLSEVYDLDHKR